MFELSLKVCGEDGYACCDEQENHWYPSPAVFAFHFSLFPTSPNKRKKERKCCVLWWNFSPSNSGSSMSVGLLNTGGSDNDGRWTIGRTLLAFGLRYTRESTDPRQSEKLFFWIGWPCFHLFTLKVSCGRGR